MSQENLLCHVPDYINVCYDATSSYDDSYDDSMDDNTVPIPTGRWLYQCSPSGTYKTLDKAVGNLQKEFTNTEEKEDPLRFLCSHQKQTFPGKSCSDFPYFGQNLWQCIPSDYEDKMSILNPYVDNRYTKPTTSEEKKNEKMSSSKPFTLSPKSTLSTLSTRSYEKMEISEKVLTIIFGILISILILFLFFSIIFS